LRPRLSDGCALISIRAFALDPGSVALLADRRCFLAAPVNYRQPRGDDNGEYVADWGRSNALDLLQFFDARADDSDSARGADGPRRDAPGPVLHGVFVRRRLVDITRCAFYSSRPFVGP
jgi:hypothetical protein